MIKEKTLRSKLIKIKDNDYPESQKIYISKTKTYTFKEIKSYFE